MKTVAIEEATVDAWIEDAQGERIISSAAPTVAGRA